MITGCMPNAISLYWKRPFMSEVNKAWIYVAKGRRTISVLHPLGEVVAKPFDVAHTASELRKLADFLKILDGKTSVILEHAVRYHEPIANMLH